ncbi:MAG: transglutaminase domain-containing protein, partial [Planctomycetaceae bacterium]|nr:transglutaminase domain-containing protein [Planctomycetaceae bacterium]
EQDRVGRARYLERQLSRSDLFRYSLTGVERDTSIDPIEDFVTRHPQGHCEYFATALTLMLRSQGIPARMVCGYKIDHDAWDDLGKYYLVRQLHAHAWVEAYVKPSQVPPELMHGNDCWNWKEWGGWLRLDPTPAGAVDTRTSWFTPVRRAMDWLDSAWANYFVELDRQRQQDAIYQPIAKAATAAWQAVTNPEPWQSLFHSVTVALYLNHLSREVAWVLLIAAGLVSAALLAACVWLLVRVGRRSRFGRKADGSSRARHRVEIEFYRRLETLLARHGIVRQPGQTQREFAAVAGSRLARVSDNARLANVPGLVAEAFYRVRFGALPLDNLQTQTVELALAEIAAVKPPT